MSVQARSSRKGGSLAMSSVTIAFACAASLAAAATPPPAAVPAVQDTGQPFTVEDLLHLSRLSDPQVSPDARYVAYVLRESDMDANKFRSDIWLLDLAQKNAQPQRLTTDPANDSSPRWAPDSRTLYFLSARGGNQQVWRIRTDGGEATRVTSYPLDVGSLKVSPRGDLLALSIEVFPDCSTLRCTKDKLDAHAKDKATGRIFDMLFIW